MMMALWSRNVFDKIRASLEIDVFRRALQKYDLDLMHAMLIKNPKLEEFFYQFDLIELLIKVNLLNGIDTAIF